MSPLRKSFYSMLNRPPAVPAIPTLPEQTSLPRRIHQTFPTKELPEELQANVDALKARNPGWLYTLYDDDDVARFICDAYGDSVYERFERIEPIYGAARADLFRYLLLYKYGGVYLDIKSTATRPLDEVLRTDDRFIIAQWQNGPGEKYECAGFHQGMEHINGGEFQQWFLVATAGHPFLKAVIENVLRNLSIYHPALHGIGKPGVLRTTGPIAFTLAIAPVLDHHPHRRADAERDLGIEYTIFPTVVKDDNQRRHLRFFSTHYSQAKVSLVRQTGVRGVVTGPLLSAEKIARSAMSVLRRIGNRS